jgi:plastocyanin
VKKLIMALVILVVAGAGAYFLFFNNNSYQTPTTPTRTTQSNPTPPSVSVGIKDFAFNPSTITVGAGATITWINNDSAPHTITSDSGTLLNSPTLSPGQLFSFTVNDMGTINYHCRIHPMMRGAIVVTN